jgi:class 3 adenylate cyclase/pimeloyl-ACP methyl ester carboxylesterase/DNA-binding CsgD family transcriptional regulator
MEPVPGYAQLGAQRIAYQVIGDGPIDLVITAGFWGSFDVEWENPAIRLFYERLSSFSRVIRFDRRGTGNSDPLPLDALPPWEAFAEEIEAVMDAAGSEQATLMAIGDVGPVGLLFASTRPDRTRGLVLFNTTARFIVAADYPIGLTQAEYEAMGQAIGEEWGTSPEAVARYFYPSQASDPLFLQWLTKLQRAITSPTAVFQYAMAAAEADARPLLSSVHVPVLVFHRIDSGFTPLEHGKYVTDHIDGASLVELPGGDDYPYFDHVELVVSALEEFLTSTPHQPVTDRVLASVLFNDIVDSTRIAEEVGDVQWKALLDLHDDLLIQVAASYGGRVMRSTGDGVVAMFDGPGRAIRAAYDLGEQLQQVGLPTRAGIHIGDVDLLGDDVGGIAVHVGARVMTEAAPNEILVSSTVRDLVAGSGLGFADRGKYSLEGIEGECDLFAFVPDTFASLTDSEREMLGLIAEGLSNSEIGDRISVSFTLAKIHITQLLTKLGLRDRSHAVIYAYEHGIVELPSTVRRNRS